MKKRHHTPEQIIRKLAEGDKLLNQGNDVDEVCRQLEITPSTWHRWKAQYGGMTASGAKRLKDLVAESSRLKRIVADQALDIDILSADPRVGLSGVYFSWGTSDDNRKIVENLRVFPEGDPVFKKLYGVGRNTSEGGNAHHKDSLPHKRVQATGRIPILLDAHLYFISENAKTWYFQVGWKTVDPILHGATPEVLAEQLELAS